MPIYEFYCPDCHRILSFLSRRIDTRKRPDCPRCGGSELTRRAAVFAISKGRPEPAGGDGEHDLPDVDEERLAKAMESLAGEAEGLDEENPRQAAQLMRRLFDASGLPVGAGMQEALARMEAGEDPDKIEEEMGDVLEADPFGAGAERGSLARLKRRLLPPEKDATLYEM
jgi:putative FmdB family regulatory protein